MKLVKLGDIGEVIGGLTYKLEDVSDEGIIVLRSGNVQNKNIDLNDIVRVKRSVNERIKVRKNDILICSRNGSKHLVGKSAIIGELNEQMTFGAFMMIYRSEYNKYLIHYLQSMYFKRQLGSSATTTINQITKKMLDEIVVPLPSPEIQKKIIDTLNKAQMLIDSRREQIEKCDELIKSQFIEMFGDPINNPMGWEVKKLKDMSTKILSGNTPKGGSQVYVEEGIAFFRSQNVWKNKLVLDDIAYIDQETHKSMSKSSLKHRDILMTKTGRINTENSSLGRAAMFLGEDGSANINGHVYLIRLQENMVNEFVLFILTTNEYREYIRSVCVGGIDKRQINKEHLEEFPIIYPPIELQMKFATMVKQVDKLKFEMEQSLVELENNFNALMQRAFKGELF